MVKKRARTGIGIGGMGKLLIGGMGKLLFQLNSNKKKKSDDYDRVGSHQKRKRIKMKHDKMDDERFKTVRFRLHRCSKYVKKKMKLKHRKCFRGISTSTDDAIMSYTQKEEEDELLLSCDEPMKESRKRKTKQQYQHDVTRVKEGDRIDIIPLLFPKHRDFLLKSNTDQLVKADDLRGKLIVLFFANVYDSTWIHDSFCLIDVYNQIHHTSPFEVVFVPLTRPLDHKKHPRIDPHLAFTRIFAQLPWTAVPYSDYVSWQCLQKTFGFDENVFPDTSVIDPTGLVLAVYGSSFFSSFGARGFPYSDQRISFLIEEEAALLKCPSIYNLLTSSERDYVISNDGSQVPILSLEDKVVALHFFEAGYSYHTRPDCDLTGQLMATYEQLKDQNFEVVLIYIHDSKQTIGRTNEDTFWETFKTMPWLALPFKDPVIKKLRRICNYPLDFEGPAPDPGLVIVGPRGEFFEPYGADILMNFGIQAYPFNRRRMVDLEAEKAKKVKPDMLWDPNTVQLLLRNESKVYAIDGDEPKSLFYGDALKEKIYSHFYTLFDWHYWGKDHIFR